VNGELTFPSHRRRLAGCVFEPARRDTSGAGILFVHGLDSDQGGYRERATAAAEGFGATCLTFDLSGHGGSAGSRAELSPRDHLNDCVAALDTLASRPGVDPGRIGVCGASYGAYLAALLISHRPLRSLLLRAPALYSDSDLDLPGGARLSGSQTPETAAGLRNVATYDGPILILESERDEAIPHSVVEAYLSADRTARHEVLPEATHSLTEDRWRAAFVEIVVAWFGETLAADRADRNS
jgi:pimeloyl-ACP methyl ester carboxylesterase